MAVAAYITDDAFRLTIIKYHVNNPSDSWANTYEFQATDDGDVTDLQTCAAAMVAFEIAMHFDSTVFSHYVFATWEPDSVPYAPANFISNALSATGDVMAAVAPVGLSQTLHVRRNTAWGRAGHVFYRNCLTENDVSAPAGISVLTNPVTINATLQTNLTDANVFDYMGIAAPVKLAMVLVSANGLDKRPVMSMTAAGTSQVKTDHKWYNRTGSP